MLFTSVAAVLGAVALAHAQANEPGPRGVVIEGDYTGALRPQIHYSPPKGFMNDPNGMFVDSDGVWHLYYQCEFAVDDDGIRREEKAIAGKKRGLADRMR